MLKILVRNLKMENGAASKIAMKCELSYLQFYSFYSKEILYIPDSLKLISNDTEESWSQ